MINKNLLILLLIILSIIPVLSLLNPGLPITHDGQDHVARIANFYINLTEGNIIPRWAGNLNWGYGHPILEFLYPLSSYIASFFHFIGFNLVDSVKIVFGLGMSLSLIFMYMWLSQFVSKNAAIFGAVLYTYAPYRFVELYVRGDIGENLAFAFVPLTLYFVYKIYKSNKFIDAVFGAISLALLILAHNAISLMFVPFIFAYGAFLVYLSGKKEKILINLLFIFVMGFGLSAFFWIPGLLEGKYTLRNIVTKGAFVDHFVSIGRLIYGPWNYGGSGAFTVQFGFFQWLAILASPIVFLKYRKNKEKLFLLLFSSLYLVLAVFLMLPIASFIWSKIMLLQNFQFPWRFLAMVVFSTSVLGALFVNLIPKNVNKKVTIVSILIIVLISSFYWNSKDYLHEPSQFYTGIYNGTTDTGESAPIWSIRFMEKRPPSNLEIVDGYAEVKNIERKSTYHKYRVVVNKKTIFRENTVYFPGWEIRANNMPVDVDFHTNYYNGVMKFTLDEGEYIVEAIYKETKLRLFADMLSLISLGNIIGGLSFLIFIRLKYNRTF